MEKKKIVKKKKKVPVPLDKQEEMLGKFDKLAKEYIGETNYCIIINWVDKSDPKGVQVKGLSNTTINDFSPLTEAKLLAVAVSQEAQKFFQKVFGGNINIEPHFRYVKKGGN